jgi:nucleotide-binding universal stress UspA family protein
MNLEPDNRSWHWPPRTVLVAVDFGEASARALAVGHVVAGAFDATLRAIYAERFDPPPYFTVEQLKELVAERDIAQAAAARHLTRFAAEAGAGAIEPVVVDDGPVDAILDVGAAADLIVLGTHGRRGPGRWWLGSVAERVVRAARVPVIVTRAADRPVRDVFERVLLVHEEEEGDAVVHRMARDMAAISGGAVVDGGAVAACDVAAMHQASLVVITRSEGRSGWGVTDPVGRVLGACDRPVIFVPSR